MCVKELLASRLNVHILQIRMCGNVPIPVVMLTNVYVWACTSVPILVPTGLLKQEKPFQEVANDF